MYDQTEAVAPTANATLTRNDPAIKNNQSQEWDSSVEFQNPNYGNPPFSTHFPLLPNCSNTSTTPSDYKTWGPTNMNQHLDHNNNHEMGFTHFDENLHPTTDFLTLLNIPRFSFQATQQSLSFGNSPLSFLGEISPAMMMDYPSGCGSSTVSHDPTNATYDSNSFRLNLPFQHSLLHPHGYGYDNTPGRGNVNEHVGNGNNGNSSVLFGALEEDGNHHYFHGNNGVFEFCKGDEKVGKSPKSSASEKQRRQNFTDKYTDLRSLIPNQTKTDRASIILDAITHIHELRRTVKELKLLVDKKRISKDRMKRHKSTEDTHSGGGNGNDGAAVVKPDPDEDFKGLAANQLRSSWIQRKCKDTEVDVRIVDDDVTIKLVQRKKINCLLSVSRSLDELQLDLRHVAGGCVGDYYCYLFNSKICEGSSVYASAIANKLIEVVEKDYAAASVGVIAPTNSF